MILEPSKEYNDLELYLDDLVEYLHPQMDKILHSKGRGIQFWCSVQLKYSTPLMKIVDYDDEENWFRCQDDYDDDDDEDATPVYLHSGKLRIQNREQLEGKMSEARQFILERNSGSIRGKSNLVREARGDVCFNVVNNANKIQ